MSNFIDDLKRQTWNFIAVENWGFKRNLISMWIINFGAIFVPFEFFGNYLPSNLEIVKQNLISISVLASLGISLFCVSVKHTLEDARNLAFRTAAFIMLGIIVFSVLQWNSNPKDEIMEKQGQEITQLKREVDELRTQLEDEAGLNPKQVDMVIDTVNKIIDEKGLVSYSVIANLGLNPEQELRVMEILKKSNFTTENDVIAIFETRESFKATESVIATETAIFTTCLIEVETNFANAAVRKFPLPKSEVIDYILRGDRFIAIARSEGSLEVPIMWKIEYQKGNSIRRGWVNWNSVIEINEPACYNLPIEP